MRNMSAGRNCMLFLGILAAGLLAAAGTPMAGAQTTQPAGAQAAQRPVPAIEHAVIISIDGCRPDVLLRGETPNLHKLFHRGSFSFWAQTTDVAITLPSHTSMVTGVTPDRHGVTWNGDLPAGEHRYPKFPTIFQIAHEHGLSTAMASGKSKFSALNKPGTIDWVWIAAKKGTDAEVATHAAEIIRDHKPQVLFVHLPGVDSAGHAYGWGGERQMQAIAAADQAVGQVLAALDEAKLTDSTFVLVSADHGGAGFTHGGKDARSRHIPWIIAGPGIRHDYDLTHDPKLTIHTEDTFATACWLLGLAPEAGIDGKPIQQILDPHQQPAP